MSRYFIKNQRPLKEGILPLYSPFEGEYWLKWNNEAIPLGTWTKITSTTMHNIFRQLDANASNLRNKASVHQKVYFQEKLNRLF